ncbi:MAG TPA: hypothetical protein VFM35_09530, partial [Candidatus Binatia bacterium]|nr:hypothetical protein [Candidatus Binatia bacterium]
MKTYHTVYGNVMDLQIKVFRWPDTGNYVIVITHGRVDIEGFKEIFRKVAPLTESLRDYKVVIDLQDATCRLEPADIHGFVTTLSPDLWPNNKVALVSAPESEQYDQLFVLSTCLSDRGFKIAVFYDT